MCHLPCLHTPLVVDIHIRVLQDSVLQVHSHHIQIPFQHIPHHLHHLQEILLLHDKHIAGIELIALQHLLESRVEVGVPEHHNRLGNIHITKVEAPLVLTIHRPLHLMQMQTNAPMLQNQCLQVRHIIHKLPILPVVAEAHNVGQFIRMLHQPLITQQLRVIQRVHSIRSLVIRVQLPRIQHLIHWILHRTLKVRVCTNKNLLCHILSSCRYHDSFSLFTSPFLHPMRGRVTNPTLYR